MGEEKAMNMLLAFLGGLVVGMIILFIGVLKVTQDDWRD